MGALALAALVMHGSLWVWMKTTSALSERAARTADKAWWVTVALTILITAVTLRVQPQVLANFARWPWGALFPLFAAAGVAAVKLFLPKGNERGAFFASCVYLAGMLTSVVFGLYPLVLPARNPVFALTAGGAKAGAYGLKVGLVWWFIGMLLAIGYIVFVYRSFAGKVDVSHDSHQ